jgi:methionyl aminopeptidase
MAIPIKSPRDLEAMRRAGELLRNIVDRAVGEIAPGMTTSDMADRIESDMRRAGAEPVMRTAGFPAAASICLNEEASHAIPGPRRVHAGDLVTIDAALRFNGWCADYARAVAVPPVSQASAALLSGARAATAAAVAAIRPGRPWSVVTEAARSAAAGFGLNVLAPLSGHGIGRDLHEPPAAGFDGGFEGDSSGHGPPGCKDFVLRVGMVITIEPVVVRDHAAVQVLDDAWTIVTANRTWAAREERTVGVTRTGAVDLTGP